MSDENKKNKKDKVRFSIGAKLILIISFIIIVSFTLTVIFVYSHIHDDLRVKSHDANFEINRLNSAEVDSLITNISSVSKTFIKIVNAPGVAERSFINNTADIFFSENKNIGAVYFINPESEAQMFVNSRFFASLGIDESLAGTFIESRKYVLDQAGYAAGGRQPVIISAVSFFSRPVLALIFPLQNEGTSRQSPAAVLFSSDNINNGLSYGKNTSWLVNSYGDVLAYSDFSVLINGTNISNQEFFDNIVNGMYNNGIQQVKSGISFLRPPVYNANKNIILNLWEEAKPFIQSVSFRIKTFLFNNKIIKEKPAAENNFDQNIAFSKLNSANALIITAADNDYIYSGINSVTGIVICFSTAVLIISIIAMALFSRSISVPLRSLAAAAKQIENGNFSHELKINNLDETGVLASGFGRMSLALNNFGKFTNREVVLKSMRGDIAPGGIPKHCTVLFSDIHDFAAKSSNFLKFFGNEGSEKIVRWLNEYYSKMIDCVEKTNGVTDKLIGDALMAHWGTAYTTGSPRNDAFACIKTALMMRKSLFILNKTRRKNDNSDPFIRIGCGISSGIATAGQIGSDKHVEYTVIGDPVNTAAQIGSCARSSGADILISEDTYNLVGDKFITQEMQPVTIKGKERPVKIFAVINFLNEPKGPQDIDDVRGLLGVDFLDTK